MKFKYRYSKEDKYITAEEYTALPPHQRSSYVILEDDFDPHEEPNEPEEAREKGSEGEGKEGKNS